MGEQEGKECMMGLAWEDGVMGWMGGGKNGNSRHSPGANEVIDNRTRLSSDSP